MSMLITRLSRQGSRRYLFGGLLHSFIMGGVAAGPTASPDVYVTAQADVSTITATPDVATVTAS